MRKLKEFSAVLSIFNKKKTVEREGPRTYKQMAITPEAHERITALADKRGWSIIDTVDKLVGVQ